MEHDLHHARKKRRWYVVSALMLGVVASLVTQRVWETGNVYVGILSISLWLNSIFCVAHIHHYGTLEVELLRQLRETRRNENT